ncbi:FAD-dependent oxidoreductase [Pseudomonas sp. MPB03]
MEICVVGAGIVGLSSAWFLHKAGHNVTVATAGRSRSVAGHCETDSAAP